MSLFFLGGIQCLSARHDHYHKIQQDDDIKTYTWWPRVVRIYIWIFPQDSAQYAFCKVYFSAQPNKLRPILKFEKYYPIEHTG